jgi:hypothetical protein
MKEFSNRIHILLSDNSYVGPILSLLVDEFKFIPTPELSDAGILFNCDLTLYLSNPVEDVLLALKREKTGIITLFDTLGGEYPIGSSSIPARIHLIEHLNRSILYIRCFMTTNPLSL